MFLQRLSAVISLGADIGEYLRVEYNTLFSVYRTAYLRRIDALRVVLGVYVMLIGTYSFILANFIILLVIFFGGNIIILRFRVISVALAELASVTLLYILIKKSRFEHTINIKPRVLTYTKIALILGLVLILPFNLL